MVVASLLAVAQREAVEAETEEEEAVEEEAVEGTVVVATREGKSLINLSVQFC